MCRCKPKKMKPAFKSTAACPNNYDGKCGADCHSCVYGIDKSSASLSCYCEDKKTQQIVWGNLEAADLTQGECGSACKECRWSWLNSDPLESLGESGKYRCRDWQVTDFVGPTVDILEDL